MLNTVINPKPFSKHLPHLDGIRGLAIILVLLYHCFFDFGITRIGWVGVNLFFLLSGYLITNILLQTKNNKHYFKNFFLRRSLRIFPLYYLFLVIIFFLISIFFPFLTGNFNYYNDHQVWFWLYIQNWLYALDGFPDNYFLHHLWSLAVEEQFYLFWPFVVFFIPARKLLYVNFLFIIFANIFRFYLGQQLGYVFPYQYVHLFSCMDALLWGAVLANLQQLNILDRYKKVVIFIFLLTLILIGGFIAFKRSLFFEQLIPLFPIINLFFACVLYFSIGNFKYSETINRFLSKKSLTWFGKYSYGLYIYHYPVYLALINGIVYFSITNSQTLGNKVFIGIVAVVLSALLAYLSYHFYEKRFLKLKDKFAG